MSARSPGSCASALVATLQELIHLGLVHAWEAPGRQRGQDVRVRTGRRPGHSLPAPGQLARRPLAAVAVRAPGLPAEGCVPAAEPPGMLVGDPERDREPALAGRVHV